MDDHALENLAAKAGLEVHWTDATGRGQKVSPDALRAVLSALGYEAASARQIAESEDRLYDEQNALPKLLTAWAGETFNIRGRFIRAPDAPGDHDFQIDGAQTTLAVAPRRCFNVADITDGRVAGLGVQLYALRGGSTAGFGDFAALAEFASTAAAHGIDALAISPVHALFPSNPRHISPYSPSSRIFLNPLYADPRLCGAPAARDDRSDGLIDWPTAAGEKMQALRAAHDEFDPSTDGAFIAFCAEGGERLHRHCLFEALDAHFRAKNVHSWSQWPAAYRNPQSREVFRFAIAHQNETEFRLFLQYAAWKSAQAAQRQARQSGMKIGIIADIATGIDASGSDCWASPEDVLQGLRIGAPPDLFNAAGQNWGITALSPTRMRQNGFSAFTALLRASMGYAGGARIDHAMSLMRLWVIPEGGKNSDGVYLRYPFDDLLRLVALESHRARAIVIGENLGTVPQGFTETLAYRGLAGMQVLWFEQEDVNFVPPQRWRKDAIAVTSTHDLPTLAGWWTGRDLEWREKLGAQTSHGDIAADRRDRDVAKRSLWSALTTAGSIEPGPQPDAPDSVVDGALSYVGATPCPLAVAPLEDILGVAEQPNFPGTIDEHPNWRRRLPAGDFFTQPHAAERLARFVRARRS